MKGVISAVAIACLAAMPALAETGDVIGQVRTLKGSATILRDDAQLPAAVGLPLRRADVVRTGSPAAMGIVLADDTTISLGSASELQLKDYAFDPKEGRFACVMKVVKGSLVYLSGLIGKLAPQSVRMETPDATIAVRGTKLLVEVKE